MWHEVAMIGAPVASLAALGVGVGLGAVLRRGDQARSSAERVPASPPTGPSGDLTPADADPLSGRPDLDETSRSALTACVFAAAPDDQLCWTAMVVDPALHDTPSHIRLIGHYETELAALDAAVQLADELNECLLPGEAPLTATALGIEPTNPEPLSRTGLPIAYTGTPLAGRGVLADLDGAAFNHR